MQGLAKSAEAQVPVSVVHKDPASIAMGVVHEGLPIGLYAFYDAKMETAAQDDIKQMKALYDYAKESTNGSDGDILMFLSQLDRKLGVPSGGSSRINKAYNYVTMSKRIQDLEKQRMALVNH